MSTEQLRALAAHGVGVDLNPTRLCIDPDADMWWCNYLRELDVRWRIRLTAILDAELLDAEGQPETVGEELLRDIFMDPTARAAEKAEGQPEGSEPSAAQVVEAARCGCGNPDAHDYAASWPAAPTPVPDDEALIDALSSADPNPKWAREQARRILAAGIEDES